uniref:Uncharacterized protein n=1 Tax=Rhizophora mucronata TaxID=61149 RepID=A0A2P2QPY4_RHIMU
MFYDSPIRIVLLIMLLLFFFVTSLVASAMPFSLDIIIVETGLPNNPLTLVCYFPFKFQQFLFLFFVFPGLF